MCVYICIHIHPTCSCKKWVSCFPPRGGVCVPPVESRLDSWLLSPVEYRGRDTVWPLRLGHKSNQLPPGSFGIHTLGALLANMWKPGCPEGAMLEKSCGETIPRKMPEEPWPSQPLHVQVFFAQALNTGIQKPLACPDTIWLRPHARPWARTTQPSCSWNYERW